MNMKKIFCILPLLIILTSAGAQVSVSLLRCEQLEDPMGIDVRSPGLSWQIQSAEKNVQQTAYQVIVSSTREKLEANQGDLWNSGQVPSSESIHVMYKGKPLGSRTRCYWKVKIVTNKGASSWSQPSTWTMGLLDKKDWTAKWIGYDKASPWDSITQWSRLSARYLRKSFQVPSPVKRATVYIAGLGLYELYINGKKTDERVLAPNPTDYRKSVLYNTYDVTELLRAGNNVIGTVLGNGRFFTMRQNYKPQKINTFGFPKMRLQLEIEYFNGTKRTIISD